MYLRRYLEPHLLRLSRSFPAVLVTGPRQVGKTTLLRYLAEHQEVPRTYVTLDDFGAQAMAGDDPDLFLQRYPAPAIIDEIQHAPQLFARLKPVLDNSGAMGQYWLTGSQDFALMRGVSESLAGRVGIVELGALSYAEESGRPPAGEAFRPDRLTSSTSPGQEPLDLLSVFRRIVRGSFPRFIQPAPPPLEAFYSSYLQTYIERDVRALAGIGDLAAFRRFLRIAAARVAQLVNFSDMARDVGVAASTVREWLSLLEATFQIYLLRPYFENVGKRQIKTPKLYFRDTGLACYLAGWLSPETAAAGAMAGPLFENYVVAELLKSYQHRGREAPLWFYRTKEKKEVDVLIAEEGRLFPVEIKLTASPSTKHIAGIAALERSGAPLGPGAVVCLIAAPFALAPSIRALPVGAVA